jgi:hypothetical protein
METTIERAVRFNHGKARSITADVAEFNSEIKSLINRLIGSKFNAQQLLDIFADTGVMIPLPTIQNILAKRYTE